MVDLRIKAKRGVLPHGLIEVATRRRQDFLAGGQEPFFPTVKKVLNSVSKFTPFPHLRGRACFPPSSSAPGRKWSPRARVWPWFDGLVRPSRHVQLRRVSSHGSPMSHWLGPDGARGLGPPISETSTIQPMT